MSLLRIGITTGDLNGIGLEVVIKTLSDEKILKYCTPIIYGSAKVVSYHKNIAFNGPFNFQTADNGATASEGKISVVNCWQDTVNIELGQLTEEGGRFAYLSLERAVQELQEGKIDALVTAPIHKKAMESANFTLIGHTEYLSKQFNVPDPLMLLVSDSLRVGVVTGHVPLSAVPTLISKSRIVEKIKLLNQTLKVDFGLERPVIAVLGLNPHAGDGGLMGNEDESIILPAILECKKIDITVSGPHPADGFFGSGGYKKTDGILAMYHDQGLIPFKALSFGHGVNFTAGLPVVRTSPDHGVAFDLAGQGLADPSSFRAALFLALDIYRQRRQHAEWHANPLQTRDTFRKEDDERFDH